MYPKTICGPLSLAMALGLSLTLAACGSDQQKTLPVGSACSADKECAGPGTASCLTDGIYPLGELANSESDTARGLADIGLPLPSGYCSTEPPCSANADCGEGGSCFFPLKDVDDQTYQNLIALLGLPEDEAAVLNGFSSFGQCLQACQTYTDCTRPGYLCVTPLEEFLELVSGADMATFCIGDPES